MTVNDYERRRERRDPPPVDRYEYKAYSTLGVVLVLIFGLPVICLIHGAWLYLWFWFLFIGLPLIWFWRQDIKEKARAKELDEWMAKSNASLEAKCDDVRRLCGLPCGQSDTVATAEPSQRLERLRERLSR